VKPDIDAYLKAAGFVVYEVNPVIQVTTYGAELNGGACRIEVPHESALREVCALIFDEGRKHARERIAAKFQDFQRSLVR